MLAGYMIHGFVAVFITASCDAVMVVYITTDNHTIPALGLEVHDTASSAWKICW